MDSTALEPPPPQRIIPVWNQVGKDKPIEWNRGCTRNDDLLFRFRSLVANTLVADMSFHVEQDDVLIPAHRLIVGMASPHLKELLYLDSTPPVGSSDTADNISSPIIIPVRFCSAKSFHQVLNFVYTNAVDLTNATAPDVMMVAIEFCLPRLEIKCKKFILEFTKLRTMCRTFDKVHCIYNTVSRKCREFLQRQLQTILQKKAYKDQLFDMSMPALGKVLSADELCIANELVLFEALLAWGRRRQLAEMQPADVTNANLRQMLSSRMEYIRFAIMTKREFRKCVTLAGPGFFTQPEINTTFKQIRKEPLDLSNPYTCIMSHFNRARGFTYHQKRRSFWPGNRKFTMFKTRPFAVKMTGRYSLIGIQFFEDAISNLVSVHVGAYQIDEPVKYQKVRYTVRPPKYIVFEHVIVNVRFLLKLVFKKPVRHYNYHTPHPLYKKRVHFFDKTQAHCPDIEFLIGR